MRRGTVAPRTLRVYLERLQMRACAFGSSTMGTGSKTMRAPKRGFGLVNDEGTAPRRWEGKLRIRLEAHGTGTRVELEL